MDDALNHLDTLKIPNLQHELRKRGLPVSGIKPDLRARVLEALRTDYDDGWTSGYLLNTKIVPFSGEGIDPQTLVGLHVQGIRGDGASGSVTVVLSDGDDVAVVAKASSAAVDHQEEICWDRTVSGYPLQWASGGFPSKERPLRIVEAAMAERKNDQGDISGLVFGIRHVGMKRMNFFGCGKEKEWPHPCLGGVYLTVDKDSRHPDLLREELLFPHSG